MRVTITGGAGKIGRFVVAECLARAHDVSVFDRDGVAAVDGARMILGDVLDSDAVRNAFAGAEAIIHLAGIPSNGVTADSITFTTNCAAAFNVYQAASANNVRRVVTMSSEAILGWAPHAGSLAPLPHYLPIDEDHPCFPIDAYGLSKLAGEQIARSYAAGGALEAIALRPPWVLAPQEMFELRRAGGVKPSRFALFHYIDARDLARACEVALTVPLVRFTALFVGSGKSLVEEPPSSWLQRLAPELVVKARAIGAGSGLVSIENAKRTLKWAPRFFWQAA